MAVFYIELEGGEKVIRFWCDNIRCPHYSTRTGIPNPMTHVRVGKLDFCSSACSGQYIQDNGKGDT